ncbi:MAG TPA: hypothetical protein VGE29_15040 [Prosthecobacter sp.]
MLPPPINPTPTDKHTMKTKLVAALALLTAFATAHEAVTIGPNGGRVIYVDSTVTPNVEVLVNKEGRAEITLLDKDRQPIANGTQTLSVTAGPRTALKKLSTEKQGAKFLTDKVPDGAPYTIAIQVKEATDAKPITLRLNYDPTPDEVSNKPSYLDDSVNTKSGDNIKVPDTAAGIWAEINQHQMELVEGIAEKKYEALDEVTRAYPKLAKGLPAQSGDKQAAAQTLVDTLVGHLAAIRSASAGRKLDDAKPGLDGVAATLVELKKLYPENVANAKLAE